MYKLKYGTLTLQYCDVQDTINRLYRGQSLADRGTLVQLKNDFNHRCVTSDVMNSFNYVENFIRLS